MQSYNEILIENIGKWCDVSLLDDVDDTVPLFWNFFPRPMKSSYAILIIYFFFPIN